jgi:hypothetical protein
MSSQAYHLRFGPYFLGVVRKLVQHVCGLPGKLPVQRPCAGIAHSAVRRDPGPLRMARVAAYPPTERSAGAARRHAMTGIA